ncbi:multidrug effflux MFS transporter [Tomitella gaofuii]|uniref:multidrug effflux MFS transporter n=1 Tax=Tomitella gaofuii TaxID=2760083 RepID=UPI0015F8BCBE|nr:multidrug effflux MFS transporter [Tomitella gaofuii]
MPSRSIRTPLLFTLGAMSAVGPLATDMYLPSLPQVADELGVSAATIQLTLTAFMVGLAFGQLMVGPLSDGLGRRRPLLVSLVVLAAAGVACAVAPSAAVLIAARLVQGVSSGVGMVIARAVVSDLAEGRQAARTYSLLTVIVGVAPILAPPIGVVVAGPFGWRGVFWVLTGFAVVLLAIVWRVLPETLPPERRHPVRFRAFAGSAVAVLTTRVYVCYTVAFAMTYGALFGYISASSFVVQESMGYSSTVYAVVFACNAVGLTAANAANSRLVGRFHPRALLTAGIGATCTASVLLTVIAAAGPDAHWPLLAAMFLLACSTGFVFGNATALALERVRDRAGTGSAVLGALQFAVGAVVSPLVGLGGGPMPMALTVLGCAVIAAAAFLTAGGPARRGVTAATRSARAADR